MPTEASVPAPPPPAEDPCPDRGGVAALVALALAALAGVAALTLHPAGAPLARLLAVAPLALGLAGAVLGLPALRRRPVLLAAALSLATTLCLFAYHLRPGGREVWTGVGDAERFHRMAEEWPWRPDGWWRYRILVPWVVHHLPVDTGSGFALLAFLAVAAAGPLVSLLLGDLGFGAPARLAGTVLYLASFAPWYNSFNYALPDPVAMVVLLLAARALARGRDGELAFWLLAGCVTKEVVLFLVPARWVLGAAKDGWLRSGLRTAALAAPAGLLFLWLRGGGDGDGGSSAVEFVTGKAFLFPWLHQPDNTARLFSPFGAAWALAFLGWRRGSPWMRAAAGFAVPCVLSLLVTDSGRMLIYLLPFAVPAALAGAGYGEGDEAPPPGAAVAAVALAALSIKLWDPFLLLWQVPEVLRRGAALLLVPAVVLLALRAQASRSGADHEQRPAL